MKMALDDAPGANLITAYSPGRVRVRDREFDRSLIVLPGRLLTDWEPVDAGMLRAAHFAALWEWQPEVLILGTGDTQVFPDPAVFATLMDLGIGCEVMHNAAACRTYNILLTEDRRVALALLFPAP